MFCKRTRARKPTVIENAVIDIPFTNPICQFSNNQIEGVYRNFDIIFTNLPSEVNVQKYKVIQAKDDEYNDIQIWIKKLKPKSLNLNLVNSTDNLDNNSAYIYIKGDSYTYSPNDKFILESKNGGVLHQEYDEVKKEYIFTFCNVEFDIGANSSGAKKDIISGRIKY